MEFDNRKVTARICNSRPNTDYFVREGKSATYGLTVIYIPSI